MRIPNNLFEKIKSEIGNQLDFYIDEKASKAIFVLPLKDNLGDNFIIRIGENKEHFVLDDAGMIQNTLFAINEIIGGVRAGRLVSVLVRSFDARLDKVEGVIELGSRYDEIVPKLLHFAKLLVTIDTMLVEIGKEEKALARPYRQSLGPRASQRMRKSLKPLIDVKKVNHRVSVDGLTVSDWMVDFAYKPITRRLATDVEMVILISVDLAVVDPVMKATYAYSRAMDIKAAHDKYAIRIAYDTHGQNSASASGANFLNEHQIRDKAYTAIDLSKAINYTNLVETVNRETGMPL